MTTQYLFQSNSTIREDADRGSHHSNLIREQNDLFRSRLGADSVLVQDDVPGSCRFTAGVYHAFDDYSAILESVRDYDSFDENNDPYQEHELAFFEIDNVKLMWKFDYYACGNVEMPSENPSDPRVTHRVLTIMLASEM